MGRFGGLLSLYADRPRLLATPPLRSEGPTLITIDMIDALLADDERTRWVGVVAELIANGSRR